MAEAEKVGLGAARGVNHAGRDLGEIADRTMVELTPILGEPEYLGDLETTLVHHMGREAFGIAGYRGLDRYFELVERIGKHKGSGPTPLLLGSQIEHRGDYVGNVQTTLAVVDPGDTTFRSEVSHERDVQRRGFTDKIAVTSRVLSLVLLDESLTVRADLMNRGPAEAEGSHSWRYEVDGTKELTLHRMTQIDGQNGEEAPTENIVRGSKEEVNRLHGAGLDIAVGWTNVADAMSQRIEAIRRTQKGPSDGYAGDASALQFTLKMADFFEAAGQLDELQKHSSRMAEVIRHASELRHAFHRAGPPDFIL